MSRIAEALAALRNGREALLNEVSRIDQVIAALEDGSEIEPMLSVMAEQYPEDALGRKPGPYSMLSVCEAAALYLAETGEPRTSAQIAAALKAGGYATTSVYFVNTVQKMLRAYASRQGISRSHDHKRWFVTRSRP
jgi:hypothetical protein